MLRILSSRTQIHTVVEQLMKGMKAGPAFKRGSMVPFCCGHIHATHRPRNCHTRQPKPHTPSEVRLMTCENGPRGSQGLQMGPGLCGAMKTRVLTAPFATWIKTSNGHAGWNNIRRYSIHREPLKPFRNYFPANGASIMFEHRIVFGHVLRASKNKKLWEGWVLVHPKHKRFRPVCFPFFPDTGMTSAFTAHPKSASLTIPRWLSTKTLSPCLSLPHESHWNETNNDPWHFHRNPAPWFCPHTASKSKLKQVPFISFQFISFCPFPFVSFYVPLVSLIFFSCPFVFVSFPFICHFVSFISFSFRLFPFSFFVRSILMSFILVRLQIPFKISENASKSYFFCSGA